MYKQELDSRAEPIKYNTFNKIREEDSSLGY